MNALLFIDPVGKSARRRNPSGRSDILPPCAPRPNVNARLDSCAICVSIFTESRLSGQDRTEPSADGVPIRSLQLQNESLALAISASPPHIDPQAESSSAGAPPLPSNADATGCSVYAEVDLSAIRRNARALRKRVAPAKLMAVVKADAYGHGAARVAPVLQNEGVEAFAVARPREGVELREAGITGRILVLGAPLPGDLSMCAEHHLDITVSSPDVASRIADTPQAPVNVHLKVDTGMSRLGLAPDEVPETVDRLRQTPGVTIQGLWTHFATADEPGHALAETQRTRFEALRRDLGLPLSFHTDNTGALLTDSGTLAHSPASDAPTYIRTGIALYGLAPTRELSEADAEITLRPALTLRARVTHVHTIDAGTSVSYGATWTADRPTRLATLGAGYGDGYPRLLSGRARVQIGSELRPVVGTICMDMCMIDLGPPDGPLARRIEVGDAATLFGPGGPTAYDIARWAETIPYEICCNLSRRVPRAYLDAEISNETGVHRS